MKLSVQFIGSGDAFGSGGRLQTCMWVTAGESRFLVDCGCSALVGMRGFGIDPNDVETIVLSHLHGDHFGGIPFFVLDAQLVSGRTERLTIAGPPGTTERVREAMESMFPGSADAERRFPLEIQELELGRPNSVTGLTVTPYEVLHPSGAPATALRICTGDWVFAYSGDTEWTESLVDAARNADLLVAEAYFFDKRVPFHLDYATLRANHDRLDARRTVLTHLSADMLARRGEVEYEIATDGAIYEVERRGSAG
jgi:ribonuclease BN (tRNA processing enzyme)